MTGCVWAAIPYYFSLLDHFLAHPHQSLAIPPGPRVCKNLILLLIINDILAELSDNNKTMPVFRFRFTPRNNYDISSCI